MSWLIGVGLAVGGSVISNLGLNLQKLTHVKASDAVKRNVKAHNLARSNSGSSHLDSADLPRSHEEKDQQTKKEEPRVDDEITVTTKRGGRKTVSVRSGDGQHHKGGAGGPQEREGGEELFLDDVGYWKRPTWILGIFLVILGSLADFGALAYASQTVVAPLGSVTLLSNIFFAPYFSDESLTKRDVRATVIIISGCAVSVCFANHAEQDVQVDQLLSYFSAPTFFVYSVFLATIITMVHRSVYQIEFTITELPLESGTVQTGSLAHLDDEAVPLMVKLAKVPWGRTLLLRFTRFAYAAIAGVTGGQSMMFAKGLSLLVAQSFVGALFRVETYLLLAGLGVTIFLQIKWLNNGLALFDALYVVPVFQAFWIGSSVIGGLVVYREAEGMELLDMGVFALGLSLLLAGVYSLSDRGGLLHAHVRELPQAPRGVPPEDLMHSSSWADTADPRRVILDQLALAASRQGDIELGPDRSDDPTSATAQLGLGSIPGSNVVSGWIRGLGLASSRPTASVSNAGRDVSHTASPNGTTKGMKSSQRTPHVTSPSTQTHNPFSMEHAAPPPSPLPSARLHQLPELASAASEVEAESV